jgi:hypothetical protein
VKKIAQNIVGSCALLALLMLAGSMPTGCGIYKLNDATVPDSIKTVKVNFFENRASYVNPQLSPRLTDKLRQKIVGQTRLTQTNNQADWEISGTITQYNFSTSGISGQQVATNRLTVGLNITVNDLKANKSERYDISRSFEFRSNLSFQQAENALGDEMIRTLTDEIFNRIFSKW